MSLVKAEELTPGQIARIRQRTYLVEEIKKGKRVADSTLVRLSCVDDDNQGEPLEVLWEKEIDPQILNAEAWEAVASKGFDETELFAAYLNTLKWNCVTSTDPRLFQSPFLALHPIRLSFCNTIGDHKSSANCQSNSLTTNLTFKNENCLTQRI